MGVGSRGLGGWQGGGWESGGWGGTTLSGGLVRDWFSMCLTS